MKLRKKSRRPPWYERIEMIFLIAIIGVALVALLVPWNKMPSVVWEWMMGATR